MIKRSFFNLIYFMKESLTLFRISLLSNVFSIISTGLIFFMLAMILSGWWISTYVGRVIQGEAQMSVYFSADATQEQVDGLIADLDAVIGVDSVRLVDAEEAYANMEKILGKEAEVLQAFDDNPFSPYLELKIQIDRLDEILESVSQISGVESVRDNQNVLDRLNQVGVVLQVLGYLIIAAVAITTLIIIAHIIRQGIYSNKDQINTLKLLGAPVLFISVPFVIEGMFITLIGGFLAGGMTVFAIDAVYTQMFGPLPFIPLPPRDALIKGVVVVILGLGIGLGWLGSVFGLSAVKKRY